MMAPSAEEFSVRSTKSRHPVQRSRWPQASAQGSGGFKGSKPNRHARGGSSAASLVDSQNSDIENGELRPDAPLAQIHDLVADLYQTNNPYNEHPEIIERMEARPGEFLPLENR